MGSHQRRSVHAHGVKSRVELLTHDSQHRGLLEQVIVQERPRHGQCFWFGKVSRRFWMTQPRLEEAKRTCFAL